MPGRGPALPALCLAITLASLQYEFNSQSLFTGLVLFLALARTLVALDNPNSSRPGELIVIGLLVAGLSSLRVHFLPGAALTVGLWLPTGWREPRALIWRGAILFCASLGFFAPWMFGLWRSSGTPLFPLFAGTGAGGYDSFSVPGAHFWDLARTYVTGLDGVVLIVPLLVAWRSSRERPMLIISYAVALVVTLLFSWRFPNADVWDFARYLWPMAIVPVLLSVVVVARAAGLQRASVPVVMALLAAALVISFVKLDHDGSNLTAALDSARWTENARLAEVTRTLQALEAMGAVGKEGHHPDANH